MFQTLKLGTREGGLKGIASLSGLVPTIYRKPIVGSPLLALASFQSGNGELLWARCPLHGAPALFVARFPSPELAKIVHLHQVAVL